MKSGKRRKRDFVLLNNVDDEANIQENPKISTSNASDSQNEGILFPIQLKVQDLNYSVGKIKVLTDVSCAFNPGQCTAVMGPSGAGKTSILNVFLGNICGSVKGKVLLNNVSQKRVLKGIRQVSSYVPQDDILLPALTPRETLRYNARLRLPSTMTWEEKNNRVEVVLEQLSLMGCADTRVGNVDRRGISGGQRKRVSIGSELLTNPSIMFVDEPTSGLDSAMAEDVTGLLTELALQGRTMICTIHQPSYKIFRGFHRVLLLSKGMVCYNGPTSKVEEYFKRLHVSPPMHDNPVDFYMRILQDKTQASYFMMCWKKQEEEESRFQGGKNALKANTAIEPKEEMKCVGPYYDCEYDCEEACGLELEIESMTEQQIATLNGQKYGISGWGQFAVLFERCIVDILKDTEKFWAGFILKVSVGFLLGLVWYDQVGTTQDSIIPVEGCLFALTVSCMMDTMFAALMQFPQQRALLLKEYKNGVYSLLPYYAAMLFSNVLFHSFYSLFMAVPIYYLVGLDPAAHKVAIFLLTMVLLAAIGIAFGLFLGCLVKDISGAQQAWVPSVIPLLLFGGYVVPYSKIPSYFKGFYWISYFQYAFSVFSINQYQDTEFSDCNFSILEQTSCSFTCFQNLHEMFHAVCYQNGEEFLESIHCKISDMPRNLCALLGMWIIFMAAGYYAMHRFVSGKTN